MLADLTLKQDDTTQSCKTHTQSIIVSPQHLKVEICELFFFLVFTYQTAFMEVCEIGTKHNLHIGFAVFQCRLQWWDIKHTKLCFICVVTLLLVTPSRALQV